MGKRKEPATPPVVEAEGPQVEPITTTPEPLEQPAAEVEDQAEPEPIAEAAQQPPEPPADGGQGGKHQGGELEALRAELAGLRGELEQLRPAAAELAELRAKAAEVEKQRRQLTQAQRRVERLQLERDAVESFNDAGGLGSRQSNAGFLRLFGDQLGRDQSGAVTLRVGKEALPLAQAVEQLANESGAVLPALMRATSGSGSGTSGGRRIPQLRPNLQKMDKRQLFGAFN